jgi:citrate synthase
LEQEDPRYTILLKAVDEYAPGHPLMNTIKTCAAVVPDLLAPHEKHPWPTAHLVSGTLLHIAGLHDPEYFPVVCGMSRMVGAMTNLVLSRFFGMPI